MTASKQRVAWLVVDRDGDVMRHAKRRAVARLVAAAADPIYKRNPGGGIIANTPWRVVRAVYDWPQKGARKG